MSILRRNATYNDLSKDLLLDKQQGFSSLSRLEFRQRTSRKINQMLSVTTNNIPFLHSHQQSPHLFRTNLFRSAGSEHFIFFSMESFYVLYWQYFKHAFNNENGALSEDYYFTKKLTINSELKRLLFIYPLSHPTQQNFKFTFIGNGNFFIL